MIGNMEVIKKKVKERLMKEVLNMSETAEADRAATLNFYSWQKLLLE